MKIYLVKFGLDMALTSCRQVRRLFVADSRLGDMGEETRFGVACLEAVFFEGGLGELLGNDVDALVKMVGLGDIMVDGTTEALAILFEDKVGEAANEG